MKLFMVRHSGWFCLIPIAKYDKEWIGWELFELSRSIIIFQLLSIFGCFWRIWKKCLAYQHEIEKAERIYALALPHKEIWYTRWILWSKSDCENWYKHEYGFSGHHNQALRHLCYAT